MFENVGNKIKSVSKFLCYIGIAVSLIPLIFCMMADLATFGIIGIFIAVLGSFLSWVSSILFYGFGELIENSQKTYTLLETYLQDGKNSFGTFDTKSAAFTRAPQSSALNSTSDSTSVSGANPESAPIAVVTFPHRTDQPISCPKCGEKQPGNRNRCWSCGIVFKYDNE